MNADNMDNLKGKDNLGAAVIPRVESKRLRLREWRLSDFEAYLALKTDAELQKYYLGGAKSREAVWEDFCAISGQWMLRGIGAFLVADKHSDEPRGMTGFWFPPDIKSPELHWALFPGNMKKGYATEAARAARKWAYENTPYDTLVSYVHPDNTASRALAERLGAKLHDRILLYGNERLVYLHPGPEDI
jgi:RimJ/RimL family protein N-acetyltransferase